VGSRPRRPLPVGDARDSLGHAPSPFCACAENAEVTRRKRANPSKQAVSNACGMSRCEAVLYLRKVRDLQEEEVDLRIPKELGESLLPRIAVKRSMDSSPDDTVTYNYLCCQGKSAPDLAMKGGS